MLVIGEKINGTLKSVARAILERDVAYIAKLAISQTEAGADFLDVNAGTPPDREPDDLAWLADVVQSVVDTPVCVDSTNPEAVAVVLPLLKKPGIVNSVNGAPGSLDGMLPLVRTHGCHVIALLMDDSGVPDSVVGRMEIASKIIRATREAGIEDEHIYFDPLVAPIATTPGAGRIFLEALRLLKQDFPGAKTVSGLSNISFGLPARWVVNRAFLALAAAGDMDAAIIDPLDRELVSVAMAARAVVGLDPYAREYLIAYRERLRGST